MWHNLSRFNASSKFKVLLGVSEYKIGCKSIFTSFELQFVNPCAYFTAAWVKLFWWCHGDTVNRKWMEMLTRLLGDCLEILNPWKMQNYSWQKSLLFFGNLCWFIILSPRKIAKSFKFKEQVVLSWKIANSISLKDFAIFNWKNA